MRKLKVLLIQPSFKDGVRSLFLADYIQEGIGLKPPIGLLYIATIIREKSSHEVKILDCQLDIIDKDNILEFVKEKYDVIGISAWTDSWYQSLKMAQALKGKYSNSFIVMGGPHVNIFPQQILKFNFIDAIIMGDGEIPMLELLNHLSGENISISQQKPNLPGLFFRGTEYTGYAPYICQNLDGLPIPDRKLLPLERYYSIISPNKFATSMITSRGCPFECVFCKLGFQKPVARSAQNVIEEFEAIEKLGIKEIEIYDDTFNWSHQRTKEICSGILKKNIKISWAIRDRVDKVKEDVLEDLKKAGCYRMHLGVESGSDKILQLIKKRITTEQIRRVIKMVKKHNFILLTYFMYGLPGETLADAKKTLDFAIELDTDYAEFSITIPYPGTEAYLNALKEGTIPYDYWLDFTRNPLPSFEIPYVIEDMIPRKKLIELRNISVKKFYFRPKYLFNEIKKIKSLEEFLRKARIGLSLLSLARPKDSA